MTVMRTPVMLSRSGCDTTGRARLSQSSYAVGPVELEVEYIQGRRRHARAELHQQRTQVYLWGECVAESGTEHQRHRDTPAACAGREPVEEQLEQAGVRRLVRRAGRRSPGRLRRPARPARPPPGRVQSSSAGPSVARSTTRSGSRRSARGRVRTHLQRPGRGLRVADHDGRADAHRASRLSARLCSRGRRTAPSAVLHAAGRGASSGRAGPGSAARPRRTSRPPRGAGSRRA